MILRYSFCNLFTIKNLETFLNDLSIYKHYESFRATRNHPKGHKYDLLGDNQTASGLIADAVATTMSLDAEERKKHHFAKDVFVAFCMHYCIRTLLKHKKAYIDEDQASYISYKVYESTLGTLRKALKNEGEKIPRVRDYIAQLALKRARNVWRKYCAKKRSTVDENGVRVARVTSMGDFTEEEVEKLVKKITNEIFHNADEDMRKEEMLVMLDEVLDECRARKILSEEDLQIICHTYGYGEGYELLKNQEIAQKLNRSDGYVTKHREAALKKLYAFLLEKKKKNDEQ